MRILITGAAGNLGSKVARALDCQDWCVELLLNDVVALPADLSASDKVTFVAADIGDASDPRWRDAMGRVDGVVHFASADPRPRSDWSAAARSFDMTANLLAHAARRRTRFVFASSNHVLGGYKEAEPGPGTLHADTPPLVGTVLFDGEGLSSYAAYGASKLMCERAVQAAAVHSGAGMTAVSVRVGWCQKGDNDPTTISAPGEPEEAHAETRPETARLRDLKWFRDMWLSNRDLEQLFVAALRADASSWPAPAITVNGVSRNSGTAWDLSAAGTWLGYAPADDIYACLGDH